MNAGTLLRHGRRRLAFLALIGLAVLRPDHAGAAGNLSVSPTRVELAEAGTGTVAVRNNGDGPSVLQITAMRWLDSPLPDALEPAPELIAVPPVFVLQPGKQQVVRLALRDRSRASTERTYRLLLSEVPAAGSGGEPGGVRFSLGFNIPVFQKAPGALAEPIWSISAGPGGPVLAVRNAGQAHVQMSAIRIRDGAGRALTDLKEAFYLLPGRSRSWHLPAAASGQILTVVVDTNLGTLEERLAAPRD
ncbi:MAG TPA: fimbria/pilus periplasmic chaperone [Geminicoccus sp.]|jgi:fimbrial chaperone protein|uniref:fimbrial biogenesis chaperone n=1 Tax=Geminicoccus sp. TaxID=2024832 RepID=UPI002E30E02A|nr:fimbria/pilus periplasmic chaperone [Geminicoccus sp.]HEX2529362.1 fimbria/pilus periplasmic chaperone [Geminicoccus sp.]